MLRTFTAFFALLMIHSSFVSAQETPICNGNWCTLGSQTNSRYLPLQYRVPGPACPELHKAVVLLHGSLAYETDNILSGSQNLISNPSMQPLFNYFDRMCTLIVLPNSSLNVPQLTLNIPFLNTNTIVGPLMRWDTDGSAFTYDKQKLINIIKDLHEVFSISKILLMGGSSGALMAHHLVTEPQVQPLLAGLVLADGVSANQFKYINRRILSEQFQYFLLWETFANGDSFVSGNEPSLANECEVNSIHYLPYYQSNRYIIPSRFAVENGHYLDEFRDVNYGLKDLGLPVLLVFSTQDGLLPCSLKRKFAENLYYQSEKKGLGSLIENSVSIAQVEGGHGKNVWAMTTQGNQLISDPNSEDLQWMSIGSPGQLVDSSLKSFIEASLSD